MGFISRRKIAAAAAIATVGVGGVVAYAYWTTAGGGSGSATAASANANNLVIANDAIPSTLVPGGTVAVTGTVTNPAGNPGTAHISGLAGVVTVTAPATGCSASYFHVTGVTPAATELASGAHTTFSATLGMDDDSVNSQDLCKGASLSITWSSSGS